MTAWNTVTLLAITVVSGVELVLCRKLNETYFSFGVPIFRQELWAHNPNAKPPSAQCMENGVPSSLRSRLEFRQLDRDTMGFHETDTEGSNFRGLLRFSPAGARIEVTGFVDWYVPLLLAISVVKSLEFQAPLFLVGVAGFVAVIYAHRVQRCRQVATFALQQWNAGLEVCDALETSRRKAI